MRSLTGTTVVYETESMTPAGLIMVGQFTGSGATPPTTASTFGVGAVITNTDDSIVYKNQGTSLTPAWVTGIQAITVALAAADINGMYAAPVAIVPAVSGRAVIVDSLEFDITRTSTAFANGGAVQVQYAATTHAGGTAVSATIASTVVTGTAGRTITARIPVVLSDVASASIIGVGLYISNATGAFDTGTGTASVTVRYHLL